MADLIMTVPYVINQNVGIAYNRIMNELNGWVGFMDHDIYFANAGWYELFVDAIDRLGKKAGFITCVTNRIGCQLQKQPGVDRNNHDIRYHKKMARQVYDQSGNEIIDITESPFSPSALVFITHKEAWQKVGGFSERKHIGCDNDYCGRLKCEGYRLFLIKGLYVYHWYRANPE